MGYQYNLILNNLDIVLWRLRYPIIFIENVPVKLLFNIRLLIIADISVFLNDPVIDDVIRSMRLVSSEVYIVSVKKINTLIFSVKFLDYCWLIGTRISCNFCSVIFYTPSLSILKNNVDAKRDLWNQICRHL